MAEISNVPFRPGAMHPGEMVIEYLDTNGWTQRDLARRSNVTPKTISEICNGKASISPSTALSFENVLGRPAHFWLNLQRVFDEATARAERETHARSWEAWARHFPVDRVKELDSWAKRFPIKEMNKFRWIDFGDSGDRAADSLLKFFGVSSPQAWQATFGASEVAYRQTRKNEVSVEAVSAWVRATELAASEIETQVFDENTLVSILPELRALTREPAENFIPQVEKLCALAGVAVVWVPELAKTGISGCARWLTEERALIALTLRYKFDDQHWFTFFHELGHVLLHRKKSKFILDNPDSDFADQVIDPTMQKLEDEANLFSADLLIPPVELESFIGANEFKSDSIIEFAKSINISPGIVVGRLQRDHIIPFHAGNKLKRKFEWHVVDSEGI